MIKKTSSTITSFSPPPPNPTIHEILENPFFVVVKDFRHMIIPQVNTRIFFLVAYYRFIKKRLPIACAPLPIQDIIQDILDIRIIM